MTDYRLYCLDGDGKIGFAEWIHAETSEDAIAQARTMKPDAYRCEIWLKNRLIAKLNGSGVFERVAP